MFEKIFSELFGNTINDFINNIAADFSNSTFTIPDLMREPGVLQKFNDTKDVIDWVIIISIILAIASMYFSLDIFSGARLKKIIMDMLVALLVVHIGEYFISLINQASNLFSELWTPVTASSGGQSNAILMAVGLATTSGTAIAFETMGMSIIIMTGGLIISVVLLLMTHSMVIGLMKLLIIIFPIIIAVYPLDRFKDYIWKWLSLYIGLAGLGPLQKLTLSLLGTQILGGSLTLSGICGSIGMVVLCLLFVPLAIFYIVSVSSNPRILD